MSTQVTDNAKNDETLQSGNSPVNKTLDKAKSKSAVTLKGIKKQNILKQSDTN